VTGLKTTGKSKEFINRKEVRIMREEYGILGCIAIAFGTVLCNLVKGRVPMLYCAFRHTLRSGNWDVIGGIRMSRSIYRGE
jgi:hypothetical protein